MLSRPNETATYRTAVFTLVTEPRVLTVLPSGIALPDMRDDIERARRRPVHCLYCTESPGSDEHVLAEALGGRLTAPILCQKHNQRVGKMADEPLCRELHSCAHFLGVKRQRKHGSVMVAKTDDGERIEFRPDGTPNTRRLRVLAQTLDRKILRADGALAHLDGLKKKGALSDSTGRIIAYLQKPPMVTITMAIGEEVERGVLKIALHFLAGFVTDVDAPTAAMLFPYIVGSERLPAGKYVRSLPLTSAFFPTSWPPQHIVTAYCCGDHTIVTVLLFSLYGFSVRLPIRIESGLRYVQDLSGSHTDPMLESALEPMGFSWDDYLHDGDFETHRTNVRWRHDYLMDFGRHRLLRLQCYRAAQRASVSMLRGNGDFFTFYNAELPAEGFDAEQVTILVHHGRELAARGKPVWNVPFELVRG